MDDKKMTLLSEKIKLESFWNSQYLSNGYVTLEMVQMGRKVRELRDELKSLDSNSNIGQFSIAT